MLYNVMFVSKNSVAGGAHTRCSVNSYIETSMACFDTVVVAAAAAAAIAPGFAAMNFICYSTYISLVTVTEVSGVPVAVLYFRPGTRY